MAWITITIADLKDVKVSALIEACRTAALGVGQTDPIPGIISTVTKRIRAEISGCAKNVLDATATAIPDDLKDLACRMIVRSAMSRINRPLSDDEKTEQSNDLKYLERIARCDVPVAKPDVALTTEEVQSTSGTPRIHKRCRRFGRAHEDGL